MSGPEHNASPSAPTSAGAARRRSEPAVRRLRSDRSALLGLALLGLASAASCGGGTAPDTEPPDWIELARAYRPPSLLPLAQAWQREAGLAPEECQDLDTFVRIHHPLAADVWTRDEGRDLWLAPVPAGALARGAPRFLVLRSESAPLKPSPEGRELAPGTFCVRDGHFELRLASGQRPPADLVVTLRLETGRRPGPITRESALSKSCWQVRVGNDFGSGIPAWSGTPAEVETEVPARSRLSFRARFLSCFEGPVTLRVRLDGATVFESLEDAAALAREGRWVSVALPPEARQRARLRFEVDGLDGSALFLRPVIGPAEIGTPAARPWPDPLPDLVLLVADTFRADGLACNGGDPTLAPALNRLAARSLRFRNAHANAAWTLPSLSTLLTGLAPGQHTANETSEALPDELTTLPERLGLEGYRTVAVTDAAFFTPTHGLDQGFETFAMNMPWLWDLDRTVERARECLAEDDGRPLFLLVHSYRTHNPYRVGPEEDLGPWNDLIDAGCGLMRLKGQIPREAWRARLAGCRDRLRELYQAGVRDLDRGFGEILAALEGTGLTENGYLLFTSDHGEALGENDEVFHDGLLFESKLRVPLLLRGPGLAPRDVDSLVSLLDLMPTLTELAGSWKDPLWLGRSLLAPETARPSAAFLLKGKHQVALLDGDRKVLFESLEALEEGRLDGAFDLRLDPEEERSVGDSWPAELVRSHAEFLRAALRPAATVVEAPLDNAQRRQLEQLGYAGDDEGDDGEPK